jgi:hypothetical protein
MTRRDFLRLLSSSGLVITGSTSFGLLKASAQAVDPAVATPTGCALNPVRPYLATHPLPLPPGAANSPKLNFDLLNWNGAEGLPKAHDLPSGTFSIGTSSGPITYQAVRSTPDDVVTTTFQCVDDAWHTPQSWTSERHPNNPTPFPLSFTLQGSFAGGKLSSGRDGDRTVSIPVTTLAALTASIPVLENAAKSGTPFYVITESALVIGPMQAATQDPINGPDGKPLYQVVALWGPRVVPTHLVYDSTGTAAVTGFLMSAIRSTIS